MLEEKSDGASAQLTEASEFIFAKGSNGDFANANAAEKTLKKVINVTDAILTFFFEGEGGIHFKSLLFLSVVKYILELISFPLGNIWLVPFLQPVPGFIFQK